ncbi:hypothetical protein [Pseudomonas sp. NPDC086251]|uniref:hypothetical protein n=1 Tax=Pseudomonas sp. NPDC086251 TaxID=3364431 RepID=UPI00383338DB
MTDASPHLSKTELAYVLREVKGFNADLKTKNGYEASAALLFELMADPVQRDQLVASLEQFDDGYSERLDVNRVNDGSPFDRSSRSLVMDDLCFDLPTGAEETGLI